MSSTLLCNLLASYTAPAVGLEPNTTTYTYNLDRQLTRVVRADSVEVEMVYDTAGRPSEVLTPEGTYGITYSSTTGQVVETTSPDSVTLGFTWDGPLRTRTEWSGGVAGSVEVAYDNDFRVAWEVVDDSLGVEYAYDGDGLLVQAGDLLLERDTLNGRLVGAELDSVRGERSYSARGELERLREWWGSTLLFEQEYERDELSRIVEVTEVVQGDTLTRSYDYDGVGRLVEVRVNGVAVEGYT